MSTTIRVSEETRRLAADLAGRTGEQMQTVVADALAVYDRALFWDAFDEGYARLAADPQAWNSVRAERSTEDAALPDGMD